MSMHIATNNCFTDKSTKNLDVMLLEQIEKRTTRNPAKTGFSFAYEEK